ncbi:MAG: pilus assembly protein, partial [Raoultibacter sp.]
MIDLRNRMLLGCEGQATLEAAYLIPVIFLMLLLLIQPCILLYDLMVMEAAASEGCRLLATRTETLGSSQDACEAYVKRKLGSIPPQDQFHIHSSGCTWEIELSGDETSDYVEVTIKNKAKLLPLFDAGGILLGIAD